MATMFHFELGSTGALWVTSEVDYSLNSGDEDATTLRVTVADNCAQATDIGTIAGAINADGASFTDSSTTLALVGGVYQATPDTVSDDTVSPILLDANGRVQAKLAANSGVDIGDVDVTSLPQSTSHYRNVDTNAPASIKGSAGTLFWIHVMNMTAAVAYVHLYNVASGSVTPGTTTPDFTFPIPTQGDTNGAGFMIPFPAGGHAFGTAITVAATTTITGGAGDPGTNGVFVNAGYA